MVKRFLEKRCKGEGCDKYQQGKGGFCVTHGAVVIVKRCKEEGCEKCTYRKGYCSRHGKKRIVLDEKETETTSSTALVGAAHQNEETEREDVSENDSVTLTQTTSDKVEVVESTRQLQLWREELYQIQQHQHQLKLKQHQQQLWLRYHRKIDQHQLTLHATPHATLKRSAAEQLVSSPEDNNIAKRQKVGKVGIERLRWLVDDFVEKDRKCEEEGIPIKDELCLRTLKLRCKHLHVPNYSHLRSNTEKLRVLLRENVAKTKKNLKYYDLIFEFVRCDMLKTQDVPKLLRCCDVLSIKGYKTGLKGLHIVKGSSLDVQLLQKKEYLVKLITEETERVGKCSFSEDDAVVVDLDFEG